MLNFSLRSAAFGLVLLASFVGSSFGNDYCPAAPQSMYCVGSMPYCCGSASKPSSLHCCSDCMLRFTDHCNVSATWLIVVSVMSFIFFITFLTAIIYCCCCRARRERYHHHHHHEPTEYAIITTVPQTQPVTGFQSNYVTGYQNATAYVPPSYNYVQGKPLVHNYGTLGGSGSPNVASAPSAPYPQPQAPPPPYAQ